MGPGRPHFMFTVSESISFYPPIKETYTWNTRLYTGYQFGPEPPIELCIVQTSLIYSVFPMGAVSVFALFFEMWSAVTKGKLSSKKSRLTVWLVSFSCYLPHDEILIVREARLHALCDHGRCNYYHGDYLCV